MSLATCLRGFVVSACVFVFSRVSLTGVARALFVHQFYSLRNTLTVFVRLLSRVFFVGVGVGVDDIDDVDDV